MPHQTLEPRVSALERDLASLAKSVTAIADTQRQTQEAMKMGFERLEDAQSRLHADLNAIAKEWGRRHDGIEKATRDAGRPNYNAIGVAFGIVIVLLAWYVESKVNPVAEALKAEREARIQHDERSQDERDRNSARISLLTESVVSNTPEGRTAFMSRINGIEQRVTRLETIDELTRKK